MRDVFVERNQKTVADENYPLCSFIAHKGVVPKTKYDRSFLVKSDDKKYKRTELNDFIYSSNNLETGSIGLNKFGNATISPVYSVFMVNGNSDFIAGLATTHRFIYEMIRFRQGVVYGQWRIHESDFLKIKYYIPQVLEQEKIGNLLSELDRTITLHEEKKHQLERLKSALLQKMFADKSGYPAVRFKKYNSAWVLRRIIDLLNQAITDGPHETPCLVGKGIPFISADAIVNNKIDFSRKRGNITKEYDLECCKKYRPQMHDIYLVKSGSTVGKVAIVETTTRFNIWSPLAALRCGEKSDPYFVFFLMQTEKFQTQVKNKASNGTQPNLSMRALERFKVIVSIELNEQQAIGNLFKKMNELIDLYQHKIDNLIAVKQWLLQNMFI